MNIGNNEALLRSYSSHASIDILNCYHEAAHAVVVTEVTNGWVLYVDADQPFCSGRFRMHEDPARRPRIVNYEMCVFKLAGEVAVDLVSDGEVRSVSWEQLCETAECEREEREFGGLPPDAVRSDDDDILWTLEAMGEANEETYRILLQETEEIVRELWSKIELVAEDLRESRRIEGDELMELLYLYQVEEVEE